MQEFAREPCPWRIMDDCGGAFALGVVGGSIFHFVKGFRNAPTGLNNKLKGAVSGVKLRSPVTGGGFGAWGFSFALCDCSVAYIRKKEDPWNAIASGILTGGLLSIRHGKGAMIASAVMGGVFLTLIEGMTIVVSRFMAPQFIVNQQAVDNQMFSGQPGNQHQQYQ